MATLPKFKNPSLPRQQSAKGKLRRTRDHVAAWCEQRHWPARLLLLGWMIYVAHSHLVYHSIEYPFGNPSFTLLQNPTWLLDTTVHEMGHAFFMAFGFFGLHLQFLIAAGGTFFQLALPLLALGMFLRQNDYFAVSFAGVWLAANLYQVQWYISDARAQAQPLLPFWGDDVEHIHDWNYLLGRLGWLDYDLTIGTAVRSAAFLLMWSSIAAGVWMIVRMVRFSRSRLEK